MGKITADNISTQSETEQEQSETKREHIRIMEMEEQYEPTNK